MSDFSKLRSTELFASTAIDFSIFSGVFGDEKKSFSDIDGVAERHGYFFFIEKKERGLLTTGQRILLTHLWKDGTDKKSVMIIYGNESKPSEIEIWEAGTNKVYYISEPTHEFMRSVFNTWYTYANNYKQPNFRYIVKAFKDAQYAELEALERRLTTNTIE